MLFSDQQIALAWELKNAGLGWRPQRGQYAYDLKSIIQPGSPFQNHVYYFHDYPCFVEYFGTEEALIQSMVWLPTVEECLEEAKSLQIDISNINESLTSAINSGTELDSLYRLLLDDLQGDQIQKAE